MPRLEEEGSAGQVLWWFAVGPNNRGRRQSDHTKAKPVAPVPFNYFREVLEHEKVLLCAEVERNDKTRRLVSENADILSTDGRVYARLESGEYYELTVNGWVSNRMIQCVDVVPGEPIYSIDLPHGEAYSEDDRIVVIGAELNVDDKQHDITVHGLWREFYRPMEQSPY